MICHSRPWHYLVVSANKQIITISVTDRIFFLFCLFLCVVFIRSLDITWTIGNVRYQWNKWQFLYLCNFGLLSRSRTIIQMSIYYVLPTKQLIKKIIEENSSLNDKNKWKVYYLAFLGNNLHSKCFLAYNNINICAYVS